jgi:hypothetical protein
MANCTACLLEFSECRAGLLTMLKTTESVIAFGHEDPKNVNNKKKSIKRKKK